MRHWFRPDSEKYMTVEMEQPFVWPETPNLQPWGGKKEPTKKTISQTLAAGAGENAKDQRTQAKNLRKQVELLFKKEIPREEPRPDGSKRSEQSWIRAQKEAKKKSVLQLWEQKRTQKIATLDHRGKYVIKS
jgi:large subunit ribosomal protein L23